MNFTDADDNGRVGAKSPDRKSNMAGQTATETSSLNKSAMDSAQKAQERIHHNEQTNSSNTTFTK